VRENNIQEPVRVRKRDCTVVHAESTVDEWFYTNGHLDSLLALAFDHASHRDGGHPQYRLPLRERQLEVFEDFDDDGMQFDHPTKWMSTLTVLELKHGTYENFQPMQVREPAAAGAQLRKRLGSNDPKRKDVQNVRTSP